MIFPRSVFAASAVIALVAAGRLTADPALVASSSHLTPDEERARFHLPPEFDVQLVAAEPDIQKPMNIAFDGRGRLWVTDTVEYPFPVPAGRATRDTVKILDDFDERGRARKITTFADGLNIPIGVLPLHDGAIVFSIPEILRLTDTDGDGRADTRQVLYGSFGFSDTHGLNNSFTEGYDGWIYACHGFTNTSVVSGSDGASIKLVSGNTYRFRKDGSHVEPFTHGQINPFGLAFDPWGDLYSSDCHSKPIMLLLRGGTYTNWGVVQDGLGEAPPICKHSHGSTAIDGACWYAADHFPPEYRDTVFLGNVVTNRINHDRLERHGSATRALQQPDFLSSDDPWFRPVDLELGPDGAIYVADFYNKIIGHYEVPLTHPGRDRSSGRIWRIVHRTRPLDTAVARLDWSKAPVADVVGYLGHSNLAVRMRAMNDLAERKGEGVVPAVRRVMRPSSDPASTPFARAHALWILERQGALDERGLAAAARDPEAVVRAHAMRVIAGRAREAVPEPVRALAVAGLEDGDPTVVRFAADALGRQARPDNLAPLLALRRRVPADDAHLLHTVRMALRDQLRLAETWELIPLKDWTAADEDAIGDVAFGLTALPSPKASTFILNRLETHPMDRETLARSIRFVARYCPASEMDRLASFAKGKFGGDVWMQHELFRAVQAGASERGVALGEGLRAWGGEIAGVLLRSLDGEADAWVSLNMDGKERAATTWAAEKRVSADGDKDAPFLGTLPRGEAYTGVIRSRPFAIPPRLSFFLAGHNGPPDTNDPPKNVIRLRAAETGEVLAEAPATRNDTAQRVTWDLAAHAGKHGIIEAVDGDNRGGWAWIAFGRLDPAVVPIDAAGPSQVRDRRLAGLALAGSIRLKEPAASIERFLVSRGADDETRAAAAKALLAIDASGGVKALGGLLRDASEPAALRGPLAGLLGGLNRADSRSELLVALPSAPEGVSAAIAVALAQTPQGADALLEAVAEGKASARLLQKPDVQVRLTTAGIKPERVAALTRGLPEAEKGLQDVIEKRRAGYTSAIGEAPLARRSPEEAKAADPGRGALVFEKTCAICHQIAGKGARIGPQLDGIGVRGLDRLLEDVLDPNRNVDKAFRSSVLTLTDGRIVTGIVLREEGETLVLADSQGKESRVAKPDVEERSVLPLSPMPSNFAAQVPEPDFYDLMAFLLSSREDGKQKHPMGSY